VLHSENVKSRTYDLCGHSPYVKSSLTRRLVCRLQLLLALASAVVLGPSSAGLMTIFYCLRLDSSKLEGQVPVFIPPKKRVAQLYTQVPGSLLVASYTSQGYGGGIRTRVENTVSNSYIVACVSVAAGTCLLSRSLAAAVYFCILKSVA
jgi:hypothetical protein